jgi:hypothetical protein
MTASPKTLIPVITGATVGTIIEWYDFSFSEALPILAFLN